MIGGSTPGGGGELSTAVSIPDIRKNMSLGAVQFSSMRCPIRGSLPVQRKSRPCCSVSHFWLQLSSTKPAITPGGFAHSALSLRPVPSFSDGAACQTHFGSWLTGSLMTRVSLWLTRVESDGCEIRRCEGEKILGKSDVTRLCRATEVTFEPS